MNSFAKNNEAPVLVKSGTNWLQKLLPWDNLPSMPLVNEVLFNEVFFVKNETADKSTEMFVA